jgi:hypothetical protein
VTRWPARKRLDVVTEPPAWVRVFVYEDWREPDEQERQMVAGCGGHLAGEHLDWHARRRWGAAVNRWYDQHPERDFIDDLVERRTARRQEAGFDP